jgi:predicted nucleotidyltransferase
MNWQNESMEDEILLIFKIAGQTLADAGVDCLLVGGHAVNAYGVTRATQDVDFLIAGSEVRTVKEIMLNQGYTNISAQENVVFFNRPGSPLRVDYLLTAPETVKEMLSRSVVKVHADGLTVRLPALKDLLAMKLFSLHAGGLKRRTKDFPDIVALVKEHHVDVETTLRELCALYADSACYEELKAAILDTNDA